ncbi:hypothetical protein [Moritella sp. F3]|uniref:hypothetical protein n=1 Tax=Moritella sp. F3 TaxID=2718882 RepID=UPI0018E10B01|nr:hypothetical protein [Moritella sp. F3]GIC77179.1 hypothetical protein FMO001_19060 [Moritella sp. F1]GIC82298.1 hypothetical protein FMO003_25790 [Moritella sp. F3]
MIKMGNLAVVTWIIDDWGVMKRPNGKYAVMFGDDDMATASGLYGTRRSAKKQITHYIANGLPRGPFHGAYKQLNATN